MDNWLVFELVELLAVLLYLLLTKARYEDRITTRLLWCVAAALAFDIFVLHRHRPDWVRNCLNVFTVLYCYEKIWRKHVIVVGRKLLGVFLSLLP